ncbi:MAG TPA: M14 family zinc carboxypeptidase [Gemmatimonadaceae bacterium]|nr:M14 family zinc carboxypeptidase [Gemmatimonadaceae bacterium]
MPSVGGALLLAAGALSYAQPVRAQRATRAQPIDSAYTAQIRADLQDPRITTELVDHLPASKTVPTPLKVLGHIVGAPGVLDYASDIDRYFAALDKASDRVAMWKIGTTEEGRDIVLIAVADAATIKHLQQYRGMLNALTDPRKTSEAQAQRLIKTAKPIYWLTSGIHSPETGGPEQLMELAYRLAVEETPFIQEIRNNVITFITPVIEVDGHEKAVDTYYFNKKQPKGAQRLPLMYWGKYVAHDNNRDGMGQFLKLTQTVTKTLLTWTPTVLHDLHESVSYLYVSTGTGPYNEWLDPITIDEWWALAENDIMEMTKRGVPGVWTYGYYDGWTPNYMFFIANTHNAIGRFYEMQSYGPDNNPDLRERPARTSREWYRPNPPLPHIKWGPRNSVNIEESALLFALHDVAENKTTFLQNYWLKNKRSVEKGRRGPTFAWVIPERQRRKADAADAVHELRHQGLEIQRATSAFRAGNVSVQPGDYIIRADQPYRTLADMYFALQNYSIKNPLPYDDTGWTFQLMRDIVVTPVTDTSILTQPMTMVASDVTAPGGVEGTGKILVVDHTADNNLMTFRFTHPKVKMLAAEEDFTLDGHAFRAGAFIIPDADRAQLEPSLKELGLSAWATDAMPQVATHNLDIPRIGYVHSWQRTQDEGWVRAALDTYHVPYTYFADQKLREGNLRAKYDVIIFPDVGGSAESQVNGIPKTSSIPLPYKKTAQTPNLGTLDQSDDIRGGMGMPGLMELAKFVQEGGTLIVEGSTSLIFPHYGLTNGVTVETPDSLFAQGTILRGIIADSTSPITYGYVGGQLPVYFNQGPVLNVGGGGFGRGGAPPGVGQDISPMATRLHLSPWQRDSSGRARRRGRDTTGGAGQGGFRGGRRGGSANSERPRVVMRFPANPNDMLLSGVLAGGQALSNRAQVVDAPLGQGHVVMFAIRPFWRWQTQGTFFLGFNAILNWNDLNAGKAGPAAQTTEER